MALQVTVYLERHRQCRTVLILGRLVGRYDFHLSKKPGRSPSEKPSPGSQQVVADATRLRGLRRAKH